MKETKGKAKELSSAHYLTIRQKNIKENENMLRQLRVHKLAQNLTTALRMKNVKKVIEENSEVVDIDMDRDRSRERTPIAVLMGGSSIIVNMDSLSFRTILTRQLKDMVLEGLGLDPKKVPLCNGSRNKRALEDSTYNMEATTLENQLNGNAIIRRRRMLHW